MHSKERLCPRANSLPDDFKQRGWRDDVHIKVEQLHSRTDSLANEFKQGGGRHHIDEAITLDREALELCLPHSHMRSVSLSRLAIHLTDRYDQLGEITDVEEAIVLHREALVLRPHGHPARSRSLLGLADSLTKRYDQLGVIEHLNEAIVLDQKALALCLPGHPDRPRSLLNLAVHLATRYNQLGVMEDLDMAIILDQEALALCPSQHPDRSQFLFNLAVHLTTRYNQLGIMEDLDEAITLDKEALLLRPHRHRDRSWSLNGLAVRLSIRYNQLGAMEDLNQAIILDRNGLELRPLGHPMRSVSLTCLAEHLHKRYMRLGGMGDLDKAISLAQDALALCPPGHLDRSHALNNLAVYLSNRYDQLGDLEDLNETIVLDKEAFALRPPGHPDRPASLDNLAASLYTRYNRCGAVEDLNEAIRLSQEALMIYTSGNPGRSLCLNNLALYISTRYSRLGVTEDIDEAIVLGRHALLLRPLGHPERSLSLQNLAYDLRTRFTHSSQRMDQEEFFRLYTQLVDMPQVASSNDLSAAGAWIRAAEEFHHSTTLLAYETSLQLLVHHLATLPSLPQYLDRIKDLTSSLAVDAFSAFLRHQSPTKAVELLEQGRGVFWSQLTRLRSPVGDVRESGPAGKRLADKFIHLTSHIRNSLDSPGADQHDRVCRLNFELQGVVSDIRRLPHLSRFLLPSLFSDLQQAASGGPVIILNASKHSCDALIVFFNRDPVHIPLKITRENIQALSSAVHRLTVRAKLVDVMKEFAGVLREIWDKVVSPIVHFLRPIYPTQSRIWWCPTAEFSLLPLHAAGTYRTGQPKLADLYISSYTPTLTALIRARRQESVDFETPGKRFVAIGQAKAKGEKELHSVATELTNIGQRVGGFATFTRIEGSESYISRVSEEMSKNEWVHLACHGIPNREQPFQSAFALHDGRFTVQQIMQCELESAEFAYLSACHTMVGDEKNLDEVIHLASAMQFAGFRSVIGTMWAVDDRQTNKITSMFYDNMTNESGRLDYTRAAFALHKAMKEVRGISFDQRILYVHLGV